MKAIVMVESIRIQAIFFQKERVMVTRQIRNAINPPIKGARKINCIWALFAFWNLKFG
jgi:hypothetical protein